MAGQAQQVHAGVYRGAHRGPGICCMGKIAVLAAVLVSAQGLRAMIAGRMPAVSCWCSSGHGRQRYLWPGR